MTVRADLVALRTYQRPLDDGSFESWPQVIDRVIGHQRFLWERALGDSLTKKQEVELAELHALMLARRSLVAGRTLWLGGTSLVRRREVTNFNCSFTEIRTSSDVVDAFWLLLNGCGVGFRPCPGTLNGFMRPLELEVIRSKRTEKGGHEHNKESFNKSTSTWYIRVGDSGEAWAKSIGKLLSSKYPASKLVLDFSEIRPAGSRLSQYGWICSGDTVIAEEFPKIVRLLNRRAGRLLTHIDILDILNHLGVVQTGRRGAEDALYKYGDPGWKEFASAKQNYWPLNTQRSQSNNSLLFYSTPSHAEILSLLNEMVSYGGSEPGLVNAAECKRRAPFFSGLNPCFEILLSNKGFCNLVTTNLAAFEYDSDLHRAHYLISRANYRQSLVDLNDGILQNSWHENNQFLRLCGTSITGICQRPDLLNPYDLKRLRQTAYHGAFSMAEELGTEPPKNVTTIKPEGTLSKIMDSYEGLHKPLGRYILNNITFSKHDAIVQKLADANYEVFDNPQSSDGVVVTFPVHWPNSPLYNTESAIDQLERYRMLVRHYVDQNASVTISYDKDEIPAISHWLKDNWDHYVAVAFLPRVDPTKTAKDLGYSYLPQEVTTQEEFENYSARLKKVSLVGSEEMLDTLDCETGVCPIR